MASPAAWNRWLPPVALLTDIAKASSPPKDRAQVIPRFEMLEAARIRRLHACLRQGKVESSGPVIAVEFKLVARVLFSRILFAERSSSMRFFVILTAALLFATPAFAADVDGKWAGSM